MGDIALRRPAGHTGARPGLASSPLPPQEGSKRLYELSLPDSGSPPVNKLPVGFVNCLRTKSPLLLIIMNMHPLSLALSIRSTMGHPRGWC